MDHFLLVYATPCAPTQNGTCHLQVMALLMALTTNHVNRYHHQMRQSLCSTSRLVFRDSRWSRRYERLKEDNPLPTATMPAKKGKEYAKADGQERARGGGNAKKQKNCEVLEVARGMMKVAALRAEC